MAEVDSYTLPPDTDDDGTPIPEMTQVTLELDLEEACFLRDMLRLVGGHDRYTRRGLSRQVLDALQRDVRVSNRPPKRDTYGSIEMRDTRTRNEILAEQIEQDRRDADEAALQSLRQAARRLARTNTMPSVGDEIVYYPTTTTNGQTFTIRAGDISFTTS